MMNYMKKWPILKQKNYLEKIIKDKKFVSYWTDIFDEQYSRSFKPGITDGFILTGQKQNKYNSKKTFN